MIICVPKYSYKCLAGIGKTPEEAFEKLKENEEEADVRDCYFYDATRFEVEVKILRKEVITRK